MRIDDLNRAPLTQETGKTEQTADSRALEKDSKTARGTDQAEVSQMAQALPRAIHSAWSSYGSQYNPANTKYLPKQWRSPSLTTTPPNRC